MLQKISEFSIWPKMCVFSFVRAENLGESVSRPGDLEFVVRFTPITAFNLQPLTFNLQPLTFNLQPSTLILLLRGEIENLSQYSRTAEDLLYKSMNASIHKN